MCSIVHAYVCVYMQMRSHTCTLSRCAFVTCGGSLRHIHKHLEHILLAYYQRDEFLVKLLELHEQYIRISVTFTACVYLTFNDNRLSSCIRDTFPPKRKLNEKRQALIKFSFRACHAPIRRYYSFVFPKRQSHFRDLLGSIYKV